MNTTAHSITGHEALLLLLFLAGMVGVVALFVYLVKKFLLNDDEGDEDAFAFDDDTLDEAIGTSAHAEVDRRTTRAQMAEYLRDLGEQANNSFDVLTLSLLQHTISHAIGYGYLSVERGEAIFDSVLAGYSEPSAESFTVFCNRLAAEIDAGEFKAQEVAA